jgi:hypothetical protein
VSPVCVELPMHCIGAIFKLLLQENECLGRKTYLTNSFIFFELHLEGLCIFVVARMIVSSSDEDVFSQGTHF